MRSSIKPMGTAPEISYLNRAIYAMNLSLPDPLSILETTGRNGNTNQITQIRFALSDEVIKHEWCFRLIHRVLDQISVDNRRMRNETKRN